MTPSYYTFLQKKRVPDTLIPRRVPLADLDLAATERVNGERGVEFVSPNTQ